MESSQNRTLFTIVQTSLARYCVRLALVLTIVGLLLAALAVWGELHAAAQMAWRNPIDDVQPDLIAADLALLSLAGVSDSEILGLALTADEMETVRALLTFSGDLSEVERLGGWMLLAQYYQTSGHDFKAAYIYRLVGYNVVLNPDLPDLLRVETLLAAGQQLAQMHDEYNARFCLQQATLIAAYSRNLTTLHQRSLLERLIPTYLRVGGNHRDWAALSKAAKEHNNPQLDTSVYNWRLPPRSDAAIVVARDKRRAAAHTLRNAILSGQDYTPYQQNLAQALLAEDQAVTRYVTGRSEPAVIETQLCWLLLKKQIAMRGLGIQLVPEWETQTAQAEIDAALRTTWQNWRRAYKKNRLTDYYALAAAYWGKYPDAPIEELIKNPDTRYQDIYLGVLKDGMYPILGWTEYE